MWLLLWSRVYNRPVYFSISTPPSNWLIKQSYLAAERERRANATLMLKLDSLYSFCPARGACSAFSKRCAPDRRFKIQISCWKKHARCVWAICVFAYLLEFTLVLTRTPRAGNLLFCCIDVRGGGGGKWESRSEFKQWNRLPLTWTARCIVYDKEITLSERFVPFRTGKNFNADTGSSNISTTSHTTVIFWLLDCF